MFVSPLFLKYFDFFVLYLIFIYFFENSFCIYVDDLY